MRFCINPRASFFLFHYQYQYFLCENLNSFCDHRSFVLIDWKFWFKILSASANGKCGNLVSSCLKIGSDRPTDIECLKNDWVSVICDNISQNVRSTKQGEEKIDGRAAKTIEKINTTTSNYLSTTYAFLGSR